MVSSFHLRVVGFHTPGAIHELKAAYQALTAGEV